MPEICCMKAVYDESVGWWCPKHGDDDERNSILQAEHLAAADVDGDVLGQDWPCCEHCDHDPGYIHAEKCETCHA